MRIMMTNPIKDMLMAKEYNTELQLSGSWTLGSRDSDSFSRSEQWSDFYKYSYSFENGYIWSLSWN